MSKEIDHERTPWPVCPHCGHEDMDWQDSTSMKDDGDSEDTDCINCGKGYKQKISISIRFTTAI